MMTLIQGCGSNRILDFNAQIQHLMQEKEYAQALAMYDTHLSLDNSNKGHQRGLLKAMQEANFDHTLEQYQKNCCLSLQDWDSDLNEVKELLLKRKTEEFDEKIKTMSLGMDFFIYGLYLICSDEVVLLTIIMLKKFTQYFQNF